MLQNSPYSVDFLLGKTESETKEVPEKDYEVTKQSDKLERNMALLEAVAKKVLSKSELNQIKAQIKVSTLTTGNDSDTDG